MHQVIKGTAYVARRALLEKSFGTARAADMLREVAAEVPFFQKPVLATSMLPLAEWLAWNDSLVRRFFADQASPYFYLGEESAAWALTEGPYRNMMSDRGLTEFIERGTLLYRSYYEIGELTLEHTPGKLETRIDGIPSAYRHPHFEFNPAGYVKRALEMLGARTVHTKQLAGFSRGNAHVQYVYTFREDATRNSSLRP